MRIALSLTLMLLAAPALAQSADLVAEGKRLSEINCTKCHNIEAEGDSPLTDAPPFREISLNYDNMELIDGFMEGLAVRHPLMPDWETTEPQAEALTAFILSLRGNEEKKGDSPILEGHTLLRTHCARCHAIDAEGASPEPKAPPFRDVVKRYNPSALEEALAEGIVTAHEAMPVLSFEAEQVSAIIAYLNTLQGE
jgi:mono/diheme cytochrome c family protein